MPRVRSSAVVTCAICERSLLVGEEPTRFTPDGREFVDVCPLCKETALQHGWMREGGPSLPLVQGERRRRGWLSFLFSRREASEAVSEPILRRLSEPELAMVEAAEVFNASPFRRTVEGIARSLGPPRVSIVPLTGVNPEVVITIAWDISWYQYRVDFDSVQRVRLAERGHDPEELGSGFTAWNARLSEDGYVLPNVSRI